MTDELASDVVPTRPLRSWLLAWQVWTGDPPATIARGFGLDERLVVELLAGGHPMVSVDVAAVVADALGVPVDGVFSRGGCDALWSEIPDELAMQLRPL